MRCQYCGTVFEETTNLDTGEMVPVLHLWSTCIRNLQAENVFLRSMPSSPNAAAPPRKPRKARKNISLDPAIWEASNARRIVAGMTWDEWEGR